MSPEDCEEWLDIWIEDNLLPCSSHAPDPPSRSADIQELANNCLQAALAQGISREQLRATCGEDLLTFLLREQAEILGSDDGDP